MLDKSICMRDQTVTGYNNRTNRSLQAGEDVCCWGITREKGIQLSSLLFSFHTEKEPLHPPSNVNAFEVYLLDSSCPHKGAAKVGRRQGTQP